MMIRASFSLVKTQVTVSPACRSIDAGLVSPVQTADARSQPCGTVSATEYWPGSRSPESFCSLSESENPFSS